jgi:hypothetical protein
MKTRTKNENIFKVNFNFPTDLYEYIKEQSKIEYMSMTQYIVELVKEDLKKKAKI